MRTTIDVPDPVLRRLKRMAAARGTTVRALVLEAVDISLRAETPPFALRDASAGPPPDGADTAVSAAAVNDAIDGLREGTFRP
jgi:hypothetical protein